ncbi:MAG: hypothetical protein SCM96_14570 [Acidobacteriota bacterium]|nr:hypothetical protein [Acidobacteriota bacterium]
MRHERGSTFIVVILVSAFLLTVGVALLTVTGAGPKAAGNIRNQNEAFSAAEAGFEAGRMAIEQNFLAGQWSSFSGVYLLDPSGIDYPLASGYFRKLTDEEILAAINPASNGVLFYDQAYVPTGEGQFDPRFTYTVFLIDPSAGGGISNPSEALMVCIGVVRSGTRIIATSRLEILFGAGA